MPKKQNKDVAKEGTSARVKGDVCLARLRKAMNHNDDKEDSPLRKAMNRTGEKPNDPLAEITVRIDNKIVRLTEMADIMESLLKYMDMAADTAGIPIAKQVLHFILLNIKAFLWIKRIQSADKLSEALYGILLIQNFTVRRILLEETLLAYPRLITLGGGAIKPAEKPGEAEKPPVDLLSKILIRGRSDLLSLLVIFNVLKLDARTTDVAFDGASTVIERIRTHYSSINKLDEFKALEAELRTLEATSDRTKDAKELLETLGMQNEHERKQELQARFKVVKDWIFVGGEQCDVLHFILHNNEFHKMAILFAEAGVTLDTSPNFESVSEKTVRQRIQAHADKLGGDFAKWIPELEKIEAINARKNLYYLPSSIPAIIYSESESSSHQTVAENDPDIQAAAEEPQALTLKVDCV